MLAVSGRATEDRQHSLALQGLAVVAATVAIKRGGHRRNADGIGNSTHVHRKLVATVWVASMGNTLAAAEALASTAAWNGREKPRRSITGKRPSPYLISSAIGAV